MKKALLISLCMLVLVVVGCGSPAGDVGNSGKITILGDGGSWIEIWDWYDFAAIRDNLSGNYLLMNDLDSTTGGYAELASSTADWGKGWKPIGGAQQWDGEKWVGEFFVGTFDGQGYEVKDVFINRVPLMPCDPTMPCEEMWVGVGLFGAVGPEGVIRNIGIATADVTGDDVVGGLVGNNQGTMSNCYSTGSVSGRANVGGLVGANQDGTASDSYSTANVTSQWGFVGGLVGQNGGTVRGCYSTGSVTCEWCGGSAVATGGAGGMIGHNWGSVSRSYYDYDDVLINGENIITIGALFAEDFQQWLANGKLLDVNERLSRQHDYYLIDDVSDFKQLLAFGQDDTLRFRLTNDLDLAGEPNFYIPYLAGEFDGRGHNISNLSFNFGCVSNVGLFGFLAGTGEITGLGAENVNITGSDDVGGLLGLNHGTVSNSYSSGSVIGLGCHVGGLLGFNLGGTISCAYSSANVTTDETGFQVGGLVGRNLGATVSNSYATGDVCSVDVSSVGGLVGCNEATVSNSYSTGVVTGGTEVGGLVGSNGSPFGNGTSEQSFWDEEASGTAVSAGGTGKTTTEMKDIATFSGGGWNITTVASASIGDLAHIWNIVDGLTYPFLSWEQATVVQYDLTVTSTAGGSVTTPGEGTLPYDAGTVVNLVASPDVGYQFVNWTGNVDSIANVSSASTTITVDGNYTITANFEEIAVPLSEGVETATGTGTAYFTASHGTMEDLVAVATPPDPPTTFPHGMFSFKITGLSPGEEVTLTVELPDPVPVGTKWWKYHNNTWSPMDIGDDDGDNLITVVLKDGRTPDDEDTTAGQITDQGGPGSPGSVGWESYPINRIRVLLPWIALVVILAGGTGWYIRRRRMVQS